MELQYKEQLAELLVELEKRKDREQRLAEENRVILSAISALSFAENKYQIFEELKTVLHRYIKFDDFIVISKSKSSQLFATFLSSNLAYQGNVWECGEKFQRVLNGESMILFEPNNLVEFQRLSPFLQNQIHSVLVTGLRAQTSDLVLLLFGAQKGQFSLEAKATLQRFRPLIQRAINDIEHKEELQALVRIKTHESYLAQQQAERANQAKSQFLAMMSHELRTPLNAVLGLIDVLGEDASQAQRELLKQIESSAELLLVIINDILDLSQIETGHFKLQCHWVLLHDQLLNTLLYHQNACYSKGLEFRVTHSINEQLEYWVDPTRLIQILINIIGNAIKFTHQGSIDVRLTADNGWLVIHVQDTGIGIAEDRVEALFSPFIQADSSITRNYGGTGLGLTITKHLVELMGGNIAVESKVDQGSTFTISIPIKSRPLQTLDTNTVNAQSRQLTANVKNILVVEDTKTNQMVIELMLSRMGYNVTIADNGYLAVQLMSDNKHQFDMIFMDISMPVMDGIEATKILRQQGIILPIIALTAHSMLEEHRAFYEAGMNDIVLKPVRSQDFKLVLAKYLPQD